MNALDYILAIKTPFFRKGLNTASGSSALALGNTT